MNSDHYEVERLQQRIHDLEQGITRVSELWAEVTRDRDRLMSHLSTVDGLLEEVVPEYQVIRGVVNRALLR